ncbi:uncharacterized protein LOC123701004 [Colias croceus]|uniref:uncharacterized protein LOC123701004 n=1 Tax=Colias crocea TaxID=72248 RepID=UPI001E27B403|nr:uncharacterized protein LOC123701004 [Colias croceus]
MPLKRTPPKTKQMINITSENISSAATDTETEGATCIMKQRTRTRKRQHDDELSLFMTEMKRTFDEFKETVMSDLHRCLNEFKEEQEKKFSELNSTVCEIKCQNSSIMETVTFISKQYDDMKIKLDLFDKEKKEYQHRIHLLESKIEHLERNQFLSTVEIRNIPPQKKENTHDLLGIVSKATKLIGVPLNPNDISNIFRIGSKPESKPIVVKFSNVFIKEKVLSYFKKYNKDQQENKLCTADLDIVGNSNKIYISEYLTPKTKRLFFLARDFANTSGYKFCWTASGKVFLRRKEGLPPIRIEREEDLDQLKAHHKQD